MNPYEARQEARRERYEDAAAKAKRESDAAFKRSHDMLDVIPLGQPLLTNHYSYGRDRRYRDRAWNLMGKAVAADEKASYYRGKAAGIGHAGISQDDPEAVAKLREKLAGLESEQERDKKINALARKKDIAGLAAMGISVELAAKLFEPEWVHGDRRGPCGIPAYQLTNRSGNMRRIRERIASLERQAATPEADPVEGELPGAIQPPATTGPEPASPSESVESAEVPTAIYHPPGGAPFPVATFTIRDDATENRIMIEFPGKPSADIRTKLKHAGFRWSPTRGAWVKFRSQWAFEEAKRLMGVLATNDRDPGLSADKTSLSPVTEAVEP